MQGLASSSVCFMVITSAVCQASLVLCPPEHGRPTLPALCTKQLNDYEQKWHVSLLHWHETLSISLSLLIR